MGYYKDRQKTQDLQNKMIKATILNKSPLVDQLIHFHYEENLKKSFVKC